MKVLVLTDELNEKARAFKENFLVSLRKKGIKVVTRAKLADLILVLGGDGWMLRCIHKHFGTLKPFLGLNFGYKGFLMNDLRDNIVDLIIQKRYEVFTFPFLIATGRLKNNNIFCALAINDVYFNRMTRQSCRLNVKVNGLLAAEKIQGDGLIVCTPLGSTGYNLAAGGSAIHPTVPAIGLTPIAIHSPAQFKPMVLPDDAEILVEVLEPEKRKVQLAADIKEFKNVLSAKIEKSPFIFKMALLEGEDFTKRTIEKIMKVPEQKEGV